MKTIITEIKNTLDGINNQVDSVEATIHKPENIVIETVKNETKGKKKDKNKSIALVSCEITSSSLMYM